MDKRASKRRRRQFFADDDEEEMISILLNTIENDEPKHGGSRPGRSPNAPRDHAAGHNRIMKHYFDNNPVYNDRQFRRRFRMRRELFLKIAGAVAQHDAYFRQRPDAIGQLGLSTIQKVTAAMRQLAYGMAADQVDEYVGIGESTAVECLMRFCTNIIEIYQDTYLRAPTKDDIERLTAQNAARGWPGMLGSLDCMHWQWKNCPRAWRGQYQGKEKVATVILEAVASYDLWIWHAFFGVPGSCNDINVLDRSPLFNSVLNGTAPAKKFSVNGNQYEMCYFLADGIYPQWASFVQTISEPQDIKRQHFAKMQEAARKDVERAFGVLQARFAIVKTPCRLWSIKTMGQIMKAAIILHNMIIEDERELHGNDFVYDAVQGDERTNGEAVSAAGAGAGGGVGRPGIRKSEVQKIIERYRNLTSDGIHYKLRNDLIAHLWSKKGDAVE